MTPENAAVVEPQPMGQLSRIIGVFFEPKRTFTDIAQKPSWLLPMVLLIVAVMCVTTTMGQHVGWDRIVRQQMQNSSRVQQLSPEQREQAIATQTRLAPIFSYVGPPVGIVIYDLLVSAIFLGIAGGIMSGGLRYIQVLAVVCYSGLVGIISSVLTIVVILLKDPEQLNIQNPLAFNVAAFMDPTSTSKFTYSFASSIDLFSFWTIFLLATGLKAAAGKKLSFGGALVAVIMPWAAYVLCKSMLTGMFT